MIENKDIFSEQGLEWSEEQIRQQEDSEYEDWCEAELRRQETADEEPPCESILWQRDEDEY